MKWSVCWEIPSLSQSAFAYLMLKGINTATQIMLHTPTLYRYHLWLSGCSRCIGEKVIGVTGTSLGPKRSYTCFYIGFCHARQVAQWGEYCTMNRETRVQIPICPWSSRGDLQPVITSWPNPPHMVGHNKRRDHVCALAYSEEGRRCNVQNK